MALPSEVGLRVLFCPLGSNIVIRTACCSLGTTLPAYSTFKAIEKNDQDQQRKWLVYWAVYGSFSVVEVFADKILSWFPLYYYVKFAFLVWLQLPSSEGARQLYMSHLRPFLLRHQARLDHIVELIYGQMNKFINAHQAEIQFMRNIVLKIFTSAYQMVQGNTHQEPRHSTSSFQGNSRRLLDSSSDRED